MCRVFFTSFFVGRALWPGKKQAFLRVHTLVPDTFYYYSDPSLFPFPSLAAVGWSNSSPFFAAAAAAPETEPLMMIAIWDWKPDQTYFLKKNIRYFEWPQKSELRVFFFCTLTSCHCSCRSAFFIFVFFPGFLGNYFVGLVRRRKSSDWRYGLFKDS